MRRFDPADVERADGGWRFRVGGRELVLELPFAQRHLAENALAALTAYEALGLPLERAQEGAAHIVLSRWRGEELAAARRRLRRQRRLQRQPGLDASGPARPRRSAPATAAASPSSARWPSSAPSSERYHREIGALLAELGVDALVAVGDAARAYMTPGVPEMRWVERARGFRGRCSAG